MFGGCAGAAYVTTALSSVPVLGAGGVTAATVAGQLTLAVVADRVGLLDLPEKPISVGRVAGVLLLGLGVFLIVREYRSAARPTAWPRRRPRCRSP